jgi:hypothetical protein
MPIDVNEADLAILDEVEVSISALSGDESGKLIAVLKGELQKSSFL